MSMTLPFTARNLSAIAAGITLAGAAFAQAFDLPPPTAAQLGEKQKIWATHYYVYPAQHAASGIPLLDAKGNRLEASLAEKDWCLGGIEGTFVIAMPDGGSKTYNYSGAAGPKQADCAKFFSKPQSWVSALNKQTYTLTKYQFGTGSKGIKLVPFRTIAVDPKVFPLQSVVYIPAAVGTPIPLPNGTTVKHDGYFLAGDTGGAIKDEHIDLFTGLTRSRVFSKVAPKGSKPEAYSDAHLVNSETIKKRLLAEHSR